MDEQMRAFLNADVLLDYYQGEERVARLFDRSILDRIRYSISPVVVQELILRLDESKMGRLDLDELARTVDIVSNQEMIDETNKSTELDFLRSSDTRLHVNDYLNFFAARRNHCQFFVTNNAKLLNLHQVQSLHFVTPDAFLGTEAVA